MDKINIKNIINKTKIKNTRYFNYYEVETGQMPCVMHLGEWMWTNDLRVLVNHFINYILKPSLLDLCDDLYEEHNLYNLDTEEILNELIIKDNVNQEKYKKIINIQSEVLKNQSKYDNIKTYLEEIIVILNSLGLIIQIHLFKGYKKALELVYEHMINPEDYDSLEEVFINDISC